MIAEENTGGEGYVILETYAGSWVQNFKALPENNPKGLQLHQRQVTNPRTAQTTIKYYFKFKNITGIVTGIEIVDNYNSAADKVFKIFLDSGNTKVMLSIDLTYKSGTKFSSYGEDFAKKMTYLWEAVSNKIPVTFTPYDVPASADSRRNTGITITYFNLQRQEIRLQRYWKKETIPAQYNAIERLNPMSQKTEWDYSMQVLFIYENVKNLIADWRQKGWIAAERQRNQQHQQQGAVQPGQQQQYAAPVPQPGQQQQYAAPVPQPGQQQQYAAPVPQPGQQQQYAAPVPQPGQQQQYAAPVPQPAQPQQYAAPVPQPAQPQQYAAPVPQPGQQPQYAAPVPQPQYPQATDQPVNGAFPPPPPSGFGQAPLPGQNAAEEVPF